MRALISHCFMRPELRIRFSAGRDWLPSWLCNACSCLPATHLQRELRELRCQQREQGLGLGGLKASHPFQRGAVRLLHAAHGGADWGKLAVELVAGSSGGGVQAERGGKERVTVRTSRHTHTPIVPSQLVLARGVETIARLHICGLHLRLSSRTLLHLARGQDHRHLPANGRVATSGGGGGVTGA